MKDWLKENEQEEAMSIAANEENADEIGFDGTVKYMIEHNYKEYMEE